MNNQKSKRSKSKSSKSKPAPAKPEAVEPTPADPTAEEDENEAAHEHQEGYEDLDAERSDEQGPYC